MLQLCLRNSEGEIKSFSVWNLRCVGLLSFLFPIEARTTFLSLVTKIWHPRHPRFYFILFYFFCGMVFKVKLCAYGREGSQEGSITSLGIKCCKGHFHKTSPDLGSTQTVIPTNRWIPWILLWHAQHYINTPPNKLGVGIRSGEKKNLNSQGEGMWRWVIWHTSNVLMRS